MPCRSSSRSRRASSPSLIYILNNIYQEIKGEKVIERGFVLQKEIIKKLEEKLGIENIKYDEPMSKHTSFKVGGNADIFITIQSVEEMLEILKINRGELPITIVGNGTNLLVKDGGIRGIVIKYVNDTIENLSQNNNSTKNHTDIKVKNDKILLKVSAGISNAKLAMFLLKNNLSGFEFAAGIPGSLGGAVYMNAGAFGGEIKDIVKNVTYLDLNDERIYTIGEKECEFTYRKSIFENKRALILDIIIKVHNSIKEDIEKKMNEYREKRLATQPLDKLSAGSTFKRGDDFITAKLIDEAGLKGKRIGKAEISTKHAGFIINNGNATAQDIIDLIEYTQNEIYKKYNKKIEAEVRVIGEWKVYLNGLTQMQKSKDGYF